MEPKILEVLLIILVSITIPSIILAVSLKKPPTWLNEGSLAPFWSKINTYTFAATVVLSGLSIYLYRNYIFEVQLLAALSIASVTMIFGQTLFTDFNQRFADRRIFRISNFTLFALAGTFLYLYSEPDFVIFIIIVLFATAIISVPGIGDSDARALQLAVLAAFPIMGIEGIKLSMVIFVFILIGYVIFIAIKNKSIKLGFISKLSIPAVPFILLPVLIMLIAHPMLNV